MTRSESCVNAVLFKPFLTFQRFLSLGQAVESSHLGRSQRRYLLEVDRYLWAKRPAGNRRADEAHGGIQGRVPFRDALRLPTQSHAGSINAVIHHGIDARTR